MAKLIIVLAGRKQAGKTTASNQIAREYLVASGQVPDAALQIDHYGQLVSPEGPVGMEVGRELDIQPSAPKPPFRGDKGVRVISFADLLKEFCVNVLGLRHEQCYGMDLEKNTYTHIRWDDLPWEIRWRYAEHGRWKFWSWFDTRSGHMTAREVMQVFGTDIVRRMFSEAWVRSAYDYAVRVPEPLVIMPDGRFPNEVDGADRVHDGHRVFTRLVFLARAPFKGRDNHTSETALDDYDRRRFDVVVSKDFSMWEQERFLASVVQPWFAEAGLLPERQVA